MSKLSSKSLLSIILVALIAVSAALLVISGGSGGEAKIDYKILYKKQIMSAVYKVYGRPELGIWVAKVVIKNKGSAPLKNVKVSYKIEGYTDWSQPSTYEEVPPGGGVVDLYYPNLPSKLTELTSSTPATLYVKIVYDEGGKPEEIVEQRRIEFLGLHDFVFTSIPPEEHTGSWYDSFQNSPLLAAWITPTDPVIREFSDLGNKLAGGAGATLSDDEAWRSMQGVWNALLIVGIKYKTEPEGFWTGKFSEYIKFPRDTLLDGEGTCVDLALMYASLMEAQGLRSYIVLVPGHAFPIIQLPSGALVPVETTTLNSDVDLGTAVQVAIKNWQEKFSKGPYIVVDVHDLQAKGVTPPELPKLPTDILERKGIKQKIEAYLSGYGGYGGGGAGGGYGYGGGLSTNMFTGTYFSIQYPSGWESDVGDSYVGWYSSDGNMDLYVEWYIPYSGTIDQFIQEMESSWNAQRVKYQRTSLQGCPAAVVGYTWVDDYGDAWGSVDLYVVCNGKAFHVTFEAIKDLWTSGVANQYANYLLNTFKMRG